MTGSEFTPMSAVVGQWWHQHEKEPPTVVLRCGNNGCGDRVGEIKTDGTTTMVLRVGSCCRRNRAEFPQGR
jgi:hypothetical protein